jgi:hypothetical protein
MDPCERRLFRVAAAVAPAVTTRLALRAFLAAVALPILLDALLGDVAVASFVSTDFHRNLLGRLMSATRDSEVYRSRGA